MLKDEKGSSLVVVLIAMLLVTVLGVSFAFSADTEGTLSTRSVNKTQAYHLARSGAEAAAQKIIDTRDTDNMSNISDEIGDFVKNSEDGINEINIENGDGYIIVSSTGEYRGVEETVELVLNELSIFDFTILALSEKDDGLELHKNFNVGDLIGTRAEGVEFLPKGHDLEENIEIEYEVEVDESHLINLMPDNFDDDESELGEIENDDVVDEDHHEDSNYYEEVDDNIGFTFDTGGEDFYVRLEGLDVKGNNEITVTGDGVLHLLIDNDFKLGGNAELITESESKVIIYSDDDSTINLGGTPTLNAFVFAPTSQLIWDGGGGEEAYGGFIVNKFKSPSSEGSKLEFDDFFKTYFEDYLEDEDLIVAYIRGLWK